ncbi:MAG TPA: GIY-YIG nuclease family protein [Candidatus Levybacteria bacterium]|nr:GIY-YIG nuclease family protein [Candidatus Levybacteria bacterium]
MNYFVYIVECSDKSLYTGFTTDIKRRISQHNLKKGGAKSVRGKLPVTLVYFEKFETINDALKRESEIKSWPRAEKIKLIKKGLC